MLKNNLQRKTNCPNKCNFTFFVIKEPFKNDDVQQKDFLQDLNLLIVKNNLALQFVESVWFKCLILHLCLIVVFFSKKYFFQEILLNLVEETKKVYVLSKSIDCISTTTNFHLWMSKDAHDIFAHVISLLGSDWQPKHVIIGLFEAIETNGQALTNNLTKLFIQHGLRNKILQAYVKDEGSNLNIMIIV